MQHLNSSNQLKPSFFISSKCRLLSANLSATNCYKVEHTKQPENYTLGTLMNLSAPII
ncbi:hypothetical protein MTR_7g050740 [Medicago truncatula]|uniref:Uncharacterized protein n=1 Tax=Medicago truncatula TaxID=3880 RepID=G7KVW9_MEDTR|nr:hypothetical protein MTR_7g050740 [Medicago truncatula]